MIINKIDETVDATTEYRVTFSADDKLDEKLFVFFLYGTIIEHPGFNLGLIENTKKFLDLELIPLE